VWYEVHKKLSLQRKIFRYYRNTYLNMNSKLSLQTLFVLCVIAVLNLLQKIIENFYPLSYSLYPTPNVEVVQSTDLHIYIFIMVHIHKEP